MNLPVYILQRIAFYLSTLDISIFSQTCQHSYMSFSRVPQTFAVKDAVTSPERFDFVYTMRKFPQNELKRFLLAAAENCQLSVVKMFYEKYKFSQPQNVLVYAIQKNHIDTARWVLATYRVDGENEYNEGSRVAVSLHMGIGPLVGSLDMLKLLHAHGLRWNSRTTLAATEQRDEARLTWAIKNGCPWNARLCLEEAASARNLDWMEWLLNHGCTPLDAGNYICMSFASRGWLLELQWAHQRGFPITAAGCVELSIFHQHLDEIGRAHV